MSVGHIVKSEASLIADFTNFCVQQFMSSSSCNSLFFVLFALLFFLYVFLKALHPAFGMPQNRKRRERNENEAKIVIKIIKKIIT